MNLLIFKALFLTIILVFLEVPINSCREFFSQKPPSYTVSLKSEMLTSDPQEITGSLRLQPIKFEVPDSAYPTLELVASTAYNLDKGKTVFLDGVYIDFISTKNKNMFPGDIDMGLILGNQIVELPNLTYDPHADSSKPIVISTTTDIGRSFEDENPVLRIAMLTATLKKIVQAKSIRLQSSFLSFQLSEHQLMGLRAFAGSIVFEEKVE